ncbi:hypothetical protein B0H11DRAFT_2282681 [Mycena galericulata]|nr:hypothetical protein B0H11DRAFT_2282681 [Mycena galericulata]
MRRGSVGQSYLPPMYICRSLRVPRRRRTDARSFSTALPLELQLLVLDHLSDDSIELERLCTVCRAWGAHAQSLIFREVWVTRSTIRPLLFLFQCNPNLGRYPTTLIIAEAQISSSTTVEFSWSTVERPVPVLAQLALHLPDLIPNVRTLHFVNGNSRVPDLPPSCAHGLSQITQLRLGSEYRTSANLPLIALFLALESLELPSRSDLYLPETSSTLPAFPTHLEQLTLGGSEYSETMLAWLSSGACPVADLTLWSWSHDHQFLYSFLTDISGGLCSLKLRETWAPPLDAHGIPVPLFLPPCPSLRSLEISLNFSTADRDYMELGLLSVLYQLSSPHLSTIRLIAYVGGAHWKKDLPWERVDAALAAFGGFSQLVSDFYGLFDPAGRKTGLFGRYPYPTYADLCSDMRRRTPRAEARGILRFVCPGEIGCGAVV